MIRHYGRRLFLKSVVGSGATLSMAAMSRRCWTQTRLKVDVGAIRWDAWYDPSGQIGKGVDYILGPERFHGRMPFYGTVTGPDTIIINGSQQTFDQEIKYAHDAGLSYWAYCWYSEDSPMQRGWQFHQSSKYRDLMHWSMIWQFSYLSNRASFGKSVIDAPGWMSQANYQTVNGRPLLFLFIDSADALKKNWHNSWEDVKDYLNGFYSKCEEAGLQRPYLVIMHGNPADAAYICNQLGADAISNYSSNVPHVKAGAFPLLTASTEHYWQQMMAVGRPMIPICQTGWDTRPRNLRTPPWDKEHHGDPAFYIQAGQPKEIASQIVAGIQFVLDHPQACLPRNVLIYSWDECAEGGGALVPTYLPSGPNTAILDEVAKAITPYTAG